MSTVRTRSRGTRQCDTHSTRTHVEVVSLPEKIYSSRYRSLMVMLVCSMHGGLFSNVRTTIPTLSSIVKVLTMRGLARRSSGMRKARFVYFWGYLDPHSHFRTREEVVRVENFDFGCVMIARIPRMSVSSIFMLPHERLQLIWFCDTNLPID